MAIARKWRPALIATLLERGAIDDAFTAAWLGDLPALHDYLEPLAALGEDRPVIFYDQLGCGKSDKPDAKLLWTIERFADVCRN